MIMLDRSYTKKPARVKKFHMLLNEEATFIYSLPLIWYLYEQKLSCH